MLGFWARGVESECLHLVDATLGGQPLTVKRDIQGPGVSCLDHDLVAGPNGSLPRRVQGVLHDLAAVGADSNPRILSCLDLNEEGAGTRG